MKYLIDKVYHASRRLSSRPQSPDLAITHSVQPLIISKSVDIPNMFKTPPLIIPGNITVRVLVRLNS